MVSKKTSDEFGDRMKYYEGCEAKRKFMPMLPIVARIDGRTFSKFTRPFIRPFDDRMAGAMQDTTAMLVEHTHARIGYTQSDEITLIFLAEHYDSDVFFGGRIQKMVSVLASMTTAFFIRNLDARLELPDCAVPNLNQYPHFDARVWQVPSKTEAANTLLWRAQDARKNGISSACRSMFSAKAMHKKSQLDMVQMMSDMGVNYYHAYGEADRLGTYWQRQTFTAPLEDDVWDMIPDEKKAGMDRVVTRSRVTSLDLGYLGDYENREAIVFDGTEPRKY